MGLHPQAEELNNIIQFENESVFSLFSEKGISAYFPSRGILGQAAEASRCHINATIGIALEEDTGTTCLHSISSRIDLSDAEAFQYSSSYGVPALRQKWRSTLAEKNPSLKNCHYSTPVVTAALTHGISVFTQLFVDPNDSIVVPDFFWDNYSLIFETNAGATIKTYPTFDGDGYNIAGLKSQLNTGDPGKRIVILNFPNNPTGYTPTNEEAFAIRDLLIEHAETGSQITVLIDDAYFGLVFSDGIYRESMFSLLANAHENILAVKVDGPTKEDYVWGFRIGFLTFGCKKASPELYTALEAKAASIVRSSISNAPAISQNLLLQAYESNEYSSEKIEKYKLLKTRYEKVISILKNHPEYEEMFKPLPFNSGYFMCVKPIDGIDAQELRQLLVNKYSVGLICINGLIRIAFSSTPTERIEQLFESLFRACCELS